MRYLLDVIYRGSAHRYTADYPDPGPTTAHVAAAFLADLTVLVMEAPAEPPAEAHALFATMKALEEPDGSWSGAEVVDALTEWFAELGFDVSGVVPT